METKHIQWDSHGPTVVGIFHSILIWDRIEYGLVMLSWVMKMIMSDQ